MRNIHTSDLADAVTIQSFLTNQYGQSIKPSARDFEKAIFTQPNIVQCCKENHEKQTVEHVLAMKKKYGRLDKAWMGIWDALEIMDGLFDLSDPDVKTSQAIHAFQTAEAVRRDGQPRWLILTALVHDLGKLLYFLGEPQWTVVADTYPVGCKYSQKIVYHEFFCNNPDFYDPVYSTQYGIYSPHCGLDNVHMSFGHDEYMYRVCKKYMPPEALAIIRYHSFFACHTDGEYDWLLNDHDRKMMPWVKAFTRYDRCAMNVEEIPDIQTLRPYYEELIAEYFPPKIRW